VTLPDHLRGDGPCSDCGTEDNVVWFTESVFWNAVCRRDPDYVEPILCIPCFVKRADEAGFQCHYRLLPEWPWRVREGSPADLELAYAPLTPDTEGLPEVSVVYARPE